MLRHNPSSMLAISGERKAGTDIFLGQLWEIGEDLLIKFANATNI